MISRAADRLHRAGQTFPRCPYDIIIVKQEKRCFAIYCTLHIIWHCCSKNEYSQQAVSYQEHLRDVVTPQAQVSKILGLDVELPEIFYYLRSWSQASSVVISLFLIFRINSIRSLSPNWISAASISELCPLDRRLKLLRLNRPPFFFFDSFFSFVCQKQCYKKNYGYSDSHCCWSILHYCKLYRADSLLHTCVL